MLVGGVGPGREDIFKSAVLHKPDRVINYPV